MVKTVYTTYTGSDNLAANAFSVKLSSSDSSYGIKRADNSAILVADNTAVHNPSIGYYEINVDILPGIVYLVSWEIVPNSGDTPIYRVDQIGPFPDPGPVLARLESRGTFAQGGWGAVYVRLCDFNGQPKNADTINVSITNMDSNISYASQVPVKIQNGMYYYDWPVPGDAPPGAYTVTWAYTIGGNSFSEQQLINVADDAPGGAGNSGLLALYRIGLERLIPTLQSIPIRTLLSDESSDYQNYSFNFKRWNQSAGVKVYRGNNLLKTGYDVDYLNGQVIFDNPQTEYDQVMATYNFRWFSDEDLNFFLQQGLQLFNSYTPHTATDFGYLPDKWVPYVLYGAVIEAIRVFMGALIMQEARVLFETPDQADKAFGYYESLKKSYEDQWKDGLKEKNKFPYAGLTRLVIQPAYSMPGGRARLTRMLFGNGF